IQSHSGWYEYSSSRLCDAGYDVLFLDRRGSGQNFSRRGDTPHGDRLLNDVVQVVSQVRRERDRVAPQASVVLLAVSWGGKLAAITAARHPELLDGLALLYPGLCARVQPTASQQARLWLARQLDIRHKRIEIPLNDPALFTAEPRWQEFIRHDPLALREVTSGFLLAHQDLTRESLAAAPQIHCPTLLMLAGRDQIIDNEATKIWAARLGTDKVTLQEYPDARHTLEFEPQPDRFVNDLLKWLQSVGS
ncbi:MAG: alpha/beta hydrolase fold protein, partial [Planctomycetota bacterium]